MVHLRRGPRSRRNPEVNIPFDGRPFDVQFDDQQILGGADPGTHRHFGAALFERGSRRGIRQILLRVVGRALQLRDEKIEVAERPRPAPAPDIPQFPEIVLAEPELLVFRVPADGHRHVAVTHQWGVELLVAGQRHRRLGEHRFVSGILGIGVGGTAGWRRSRREARDARREKEIETSVDREVVEATAAKLRKDTVVRPLGKRIGRKI